MKKETRTIVYDEELGLEAYCLEGIVQPFPTHFHEYYVVGLMEGGRRAMCCNNREYSLKKGDIVLFHPGESHSCAQLGEDALDYRAINITKEMMLDLTEEVTGRRELPGFSETVIDNSEAACYLHELHEWMMSGSGEFGKEEALLLLVSLLLQSYGQPFERSVPECPAEIGRACEFMERHFAERISLEQICRCAGLSKSALLRAFTKSRGVTPYRYLETVRIGEAKKLLEAGVAPIETAMRTGFSDQSHFTNYFGSFIGLTPGAYRDIFEEKNTAGGKRHGA